ncbi:Fe-S oxidoreductase (modular protein) [uncultured Alphaproteobacteria bacterium]|uniref:Fe-S oxidoreductase (Modular protein) n=1 Tax=uncultured Alphaproteobacteria bacterium TaxID=91750 RepID=A0A212ITK4_9PROT|nr:Fe-S oxidoreductase (modular protein) [uncultured Alphaproteobacteria bacterium]
MRLLLINPLLPHSFWSFKWAVTQILPDKRAVNPPLGLATVAALCPADWDVEIYDENIEELPLAPEADVVGIGGMAVQGPRQRELIAYYRQRGYHVVVGGAAASLCPETYAGVADTVVAGEAERIWPEFCRDFAAGRPRALYQETGTIEMSESPVPRFDLLKLPLYGNATLQYSRGCPFTCEFCDIIVMFGRKPRTKSPEQVGRELDALRHAGMRSVFFVDDNMIGNKARTKDLLRYLIDYQARHDYVFSFGTEASLNLAQDEELLRLFHEAHFGWVFIGIESPDAASLKETGKTQNLREDILVSVQRLYARGIDVIAGFIIGFDNDTTATFEAQYRFITAAGIQSAMIGLLTALPRTPLYERMEREGRLRSVADQSDNTSLRTNIIPKTMSDAEMSRLYRDLYARLLTDDGIATRIRNKTRVFGRAGYSGGYSVWQNLGIVSRLLTQGIFPGGFGRTFQFLRSLPLMRPSLLPLAISDWIIGLSMRAFAEEHLAATAPEPITEASLIEAALAAIRGQLAPNEAWVTRESATAPPILTVRLDGAPNDGFFEEAEPYLAHLLAQSRARLTLAVDRLAPQDLGPFEAMLSRLSSYGDRISLVVNESFKQRVRIDLSAFDLVSAPSTAPSP